MQRPCGQICGQRHISGTGRADWGAVEVGFWNLIGMGNHKEVLSKEIMTRGSPSGSHWLHGLQEGSTRTTGCGR